MNQQLLPTVAFVVPRPFQWELRTRKLVTSFDHTSDDCPKECWARISQIVYDATGIYYPWYTVPECIGYQYVVPKGEYCGSLVKRLRRYLHRNLAPELFAKITSDVLGHIGSIVGEYQNAKVWFDFTDRFDWCDGDFGDGGSCFMSKTGCRYWMRERLEEHGCHAIRFYDELGNGKARAILVPHEGGLVVVNSYGFSLLKTARIVSSIVGMPYRKVQVANNDDTAGDFYLNGGDGFVISNDACEVYDEDGSDTIDFGLDCSRPCDHCSNCDCELSDDDTIVVDGETYCRDCVNYCESCEEYHTGENTTVHTSCSRTIEVCDSCRDNRDYICCPCCDEYFEQ
jgi:hypothetical protein